MVVHDFHIVRSIVFPPKTDSALAVNADAVLTTAVARQRFQAIPATDIQFLQRPGAIQFDEFIVRSLSKSVVGQHSFAVEQPISVPVVKALDHQAATYLSA